MVNKLSDFVTVNRQFLRSVRLDADLGRADAVQGYVLQSSTQSALETMSKHLLHSQQRAFTWTGPYGGGKSSLALVLASLAGGTSLGRKTALAALKQGATEGIQKYFGGKKPWAVLPVVGKRTCVIEEISLSIDAHLQPIYDGNRQYGGQRDVIGELVHAAESRDDIGGVLLIIDELGKFLEHSAQNGADIGFYQNLAEAASRCKGKFVVVGILHQAFEQYASRLGTNVQQEWAKVQGRYIDISLTAGVDEVISLIGRALKVDFDHKQVSINVAERVSAVIKKRKSSAVSNINELLDQCWPLHPVTATLLGPASKRRFAQNERSVFSFLASAEPLGFIEVVSGLDAHASSYYWPHQFWDYLRINFEPAILASPDGHRWASCAEAIERAEAKFSDLHVRLVKTVGLIEIFRSGSGLAAEEDLLCVSVGNEATPAEVIDALNQLVTASILVFRKHLTAYGITAGSDFDIEAAVKNVKAQLGNTDLSQLGKLVDLGPITARRHYWKTGAMRWFSKNIINESEAESYISNYNPTGSQCGEFLLLLGWQEAVQADVNSRQTRTKQLAKLAHAKGLLIGAPKEVDRIEELAGELTILQHVSQNSQELEGDNIARREIDARLQAIRLMLSDELRNAFQSSVWFYASGPADTRKYLAQSLAHIASQIAEEIYCEAPHVHSELVNRDILSSNAAKAQRELLHAMLTKSHLKSLGYTSFSADAGLYQTVVSALGLHRQIGETWRFCDPVGTERSGSLVAAWEAAKTLMLKSEGIVSLTELYELWSAKPRGIKAGLLPILALAFFLAHRNQLALYVENMFTPDVTDAHIDEWLQDPKRIGWRHIRIESTEKKMLQLLSSELSKRLGGPVAADALESARALVGFVFGLPSWTRRTSRVSDEAKEVRRLLLNASDPHKVLFADLPLIFGTRDPAALACKVADITGELVEAFTARMREIEGNLFRALDHQGDVKQLKARGHLVAELGGDFKLQAFAARLSAYTGSAEDLEGLLMLAIVKSSRDWTDSDVDSGEMQLLSWAMEFRRLESLAEVRNRPATRRAIGVVFGTKKTVSGTFDVSESDRRAIEMLANELLEKMKFGNWKREVFLAAIAEAGATVFESLNDVDGVMNG